eukprot:CAMPEP_0118940824 /NCGR_PEP_ID=MMETSP1169-20130426/32423_1 /TAXON_ID=36882 /ORGANISM="Pyramimonas obovata, Strain CCMP722" /LENGTH=106 /DNA_ID=CAMNT_0006885423 /DNA_START=812 /DNA_END=1132 /DNA_ORIENTATION=-
MVVARELHKRIPPTIRILLVNEAQSLCHVIHHLLCSQDARGGQLALTNGLHAGRRYQVEAALHRVLRHHHPLVGNAVYHPGRERVLALVAGELGGEPPRAHPGGVL